MEHQFFGMTVADLERMAYQLAMRNRLMRVRRVREKNYEKIGLKIYVPSNKISWRA